MCAFINFETVLTPYSGNPQIKKKSAYTVFINLQVKLLWVKHLV